MTKPRSPAQKTQALSNLSNMWASRRNKSCVLSTVCDENVSPSPCTRSRALNLETLQLENKELHLQIQQMEGHMRDRESAWQSYANNAASELQSTRDLLYQSQTQVTQLQNRLTGALADLHVRDNCLLQVRDELKTALHKLSEANLKLRNAEEARVALQTETVELSARCNSLVRRARRNCEKASRSRKAIEREVNKAVAKTKAAMSTYQVKNKGIITHETRQMVLGLVAEGIPACHVWSAITKLAGCFGITLKGAISRRSIRRILCEGGVAAHMQLAIELSETDSFTISTDGTSHRHIPHGSSHVVLRLPGSDIPVTRTLPVSSGANHTSETQLAWIRANLQAICDIWKASPKESRYPLLSFARLFVKLLGMGSDHAEDQKKLARLIEELKRICRYFVLGEDALFAMSTEEMMAVLTTKAQDQVEKVGGLDEWQALDEATQEKYSRKAYEDMCRAIGTDLFQTLPENERRLLLLFIWGGCCMHKDDNAVKGGYARMSEWWNKVGLPGPIRLMNRDNAAAAASGSDQARRRAEEVSG
ncbi:hypothetical protein K474DRAFT_1703403 [Panus rudis PR-1116 ss-1]|nr:hypothetical protein K474DRAFT_1703403 [Panus rudis PR-1116 ss-1]